MKTRDFWSPTKAAADKTEPVGMVIAAAERIAAERLAARPGCGSPDGQLAHDEMVAIAAMMECGNSRYVYKGQVMPWWHHEMFGPARHAAMRVASGAA